MKAITPSRKLTAAELRLLSEVQPAGGRACTVLLANKEQREAAKTLCQVRLGEVRAAVVGFRDGEPSAFTLTGTPKKQFLVLSNIANGNQRLGMVIDRRVK